MYGKNRIIPALVIFAGLMTFPIWYNGGKTGTPPKPQKPEGYENCVKPTEYMRNSHMVLLNTWRDDVIRGNNREPIIVDGKEFPKTLQTGCMGCHKDKKKFCDECHNYTAVKPYCWDCHIIPPEEKI
jgi:hypothetical protein